MDKLEIEVGNASDGELYSLQSKLAAMGFNTHAINMIITSRDSTFLFIPLGGRKNLSLANESQVIWNNADDVLGAHYIPVELATVMEVLNT